MRLSVKPLLPEGPLRGIVSWRAKASPDIGRVEFIVDGRVVHVDRRRPFAYRAQHGEARQPRLQAAGARRSPARAATTSRADRVLVDNKTFALTSAGARPWMQAPTQDPAARAAVGRRRRRRWSSRSTAGGAPSTGARRSSSRWSTSAGEARQARAPRSPPRRSTAASPCGGSRSSCRPPPKPAAGRSPRRSRCRSRSPAMSVTDGQEAHRPRRLARRRPRAAQRGRVPRRRRAARQRRRRALHARPGTPPPSSRGRTA